MSFATDKQTLDDLNIIRKQLDGTVFNIYNRTKTRGGAEILEQMFLSPLSDAEAIAGRSGIIQYFGVTNTAFPFLTEHLDEAEALLAMTDPRTKLQKDDISLNRRLTQLVAADGDYKVIQRGVIAIISLLAQAQQFVEKAGTAILETAYRVQLEEIKELLANVQIAPLIKQDIKNKLSYQQVAELDELLRFKLRSRLKQLLAIVYSLDVYISVAQIAIKHGYTYPKVSTATGEHNLVISGLYHPLVKNAVDNNLHITSQNNVVFLTGANMAGKSTFMKSLGIALYLAHMGFPVAAQQMTFSVLDGMYTTINLPDDLGSGNSHFYAEVMRVKKVARELAGNKNIFVIFDELFRGTNVKDAYEGTIAITEAFAEKKNSIFVISTHIIEAGDVLKQRCKNIQFVYLPTRMNGNTPVYTYKLENGITADRHGMIIINNERILEILRSRKHKAIR